MSTDTKYYAALDRDEIFQIGPYPSIEKAREECLLQWQLEQRGYPVSDGPIPDKPINPDGLIVKVGILRDFIPSIHVDDIIEQVAASAWEECGEAADDYLGNIIELERRSLESALNLVLRGWLVETDNLPTFGQIRNVKRYSYQKDGTWLELMPKD